MAQVTTTDKEDWVEKAATYGCGYPIMFAILFIGLPLLVWGIFSLLFGDLVSWWRNVFGDPIFRLVARALIMSRGDILMAIGLVVVASWIFFNFMAAIPRWSGYRLGKYQSSWDPESTAMQNVRSTLRKMFADDTEKIALYESRLTSNNISPNQACLFGGGGCLFGLIWLIASIPLNLAVGLAIFDALMRLFASSDTLPNIMISAGHLAPDLKLLLPVPDQVHGITLTARNWQLVVILGVLSWIYWAIQNFSVTGWTWPKGVSKSNWFMYGLGLIFSYLFLNGTLLIFIIFYQTTHLLVFILNRFIWRVSYLHFLRFRSRRQAIYESV